MREEIIAKVKEAGVVGAGGAGFPTHVKISAKADVVVVNGAECEPLLRVDQQLMREKSEQMLNGLEMVMKATDAQEGIIALKGKYKRAIQALKENINGRSMTIKVLDDFYPAGDEHVTVFETLGTLVPQGGLPVQVGCVVINVETLINVEQAVMGKPVTDTYLTVTGEVADPITIKVPIGVPVGEVLRTVGIDPKATKKKVIDGGPMMGRILDDLSEPVTKASKGLIVLSEDHPLIRKREKSIDRIIKESNAACIQCRFCTDLCPRFLLGHRLEPHKIMRALRHIHGHEETLKMALVCSECGICEQYACIMDLSPRKVNAMLKKELAKKGLKPETPQLQTLSELQPYRKIPVKRLIARLGLSHYDREAPLQETGENSYHKVYLKLQQHVGKPAEPVIQVGDKVEKGMIVARIPEGALGANIHASISGTVVEVSDCVVIYSGEGCEY